MKVPQIEIPYRWENVNPKNENIDVFVKLESDYTYVVTLATPNSFESCLEENNYFLPGYRPVIFVKKLTKKIVEETIRVYAEKDEGYWLKFHHFAEKIHKTILDKLQLQDNENQKKSDNLRIKNSHFGYLTIPINTEEGYIFNLTLTTVKNLELLMDQKKRITLNLVLS